MGQSPNNANTMDAQIELSKVECAEDMGNNAVQKDAQIKQGEKGCVEGMEHTKTHLLAK